MASSDPPRCCDIARRKQITRLHISVHRRNEFFSSMNLMLCASSFALTPNCDRHESLRIAQRDDCLLLDMLASCDHHHRLNFALWAACPLDVEGQFIRTVGRVDRRRVGVGLW